MGRRQGPPPAAREAMIGSGDLRRVVAGEAGGRGGGHLAVEAAPTVATHRTRAHHRHGEGAAAGDCLDGVGRHWCQLARPRLVGSGARPGGHRGRWLGRGGKMPPRPSRPAATASRSARSIGSASAGTAQATLPPAMSRVGSRWSQPRRPTVWADAHRGNPSPRGGAGGGLPRRARSGGIDALRKGCGTLRGRPATRWTTEGPATVSCGDQRSRRDARTWCADAAGVRGGSAHPGVGP